MKIDANKALAVVQINLRHLTPAYIVTATFITVGIYNLIGTLSGLTDNFYVDMANYLYLLAVIAPIIISTRNFNRIIHLNGKKVDFYFGALLTYSLIAAAVSLICILFFVFTRVLFGDKLVINSLVDVFGWWSNGVILAFLQQFFFLLLVSVFFHTLTSMQTFWLGWVVDIVLVAALGIMLPVANLRNLLVRFFNLIILYENAAIQMASCLLLSVVLYALGLLILRRRRI